MQRVDVVIVGGGLAGSLAAAMLGHKLIDAVVIDPHRSHPPEFRCEKLDGVQTALLKKTGLADAVLTATTPDRESWVARFGRVVDKRPGDQHGIYYADLVNRVRALIPSNVKMTQAKAIAIRTSGEHQHVTLSTGEELEPRLVVLANGLNFSLRNNLGITREVLSESHSISVGFDAVPIARPSFDFPALTYYAERTSDRAAFITLFPIASNMRANLFVYRDIKDPWLKELRTRPQETLYSMWSGLRDIMGEFAVEGPIQIRPVDLYRSQGYRSAGVVLAGDAFSTSCPAAGTGARKVLVDVERLCNIHIPQWLSTPGMGVEKISTFYDDPAKMASDAFALDKAFAVRAFATSGALSWRARRVAKFLSQSVMGAVRTLERHPLPYASDIVPASEATLVPWHNLNEHPARTRLDA